MPTGLPSILLSHRQQICHLECLGFQEDPGTKFTVDYHCSLLLKRLTQLVLELHGNLDDNLKNGSYYD